MTGSVSGQTPRNENNLQTKDQASNYFLLLDDTSLDANKTYQNEVKKIHALGEAEDLTGLTRAADSIERTWGHHTDMRGYFALMDVVTNVLCSNTFSAKDFLTQYKLTQKYVLLTLAHDPVPLNMMLTLLPRLIPEEDIVTQKKPFNTKDWVQMRRARTPLWLRTRQRLKQLVIPGCDLTRSFPMSNVVGFPSFTDTKRAQDRRKEIDANNKMITERDLQIRVHSLDTLYSPIAEAEVVAYYSRAPYDLPELERFLNAFEVDAATQQRILETVGKNIVAAS